MGDNRPMPLSAVRTTGIYCHPGCSSSPLPGNVVQYPSAAAAEADGFRACLRCRPYRTHHADPYVPDPELVCRAVRLILAGGLDDAKEDDLAARVGVSGRHLRRLFLDHVGATPDQVARSGRAHFARRLLDDTDLPVSDVAFAAGFGSVRQMNRVMQDVFQASPTALRAKRRRTDRLVADGGLDTRLTFRPPLDWDEMLSFLARRAIPGVESITSTDDRGGVYRRTIETDGRIGALEVWRGDDEHLVARFHLPYWEGLIHLVARVRRCFDLDHDPVPVCHAFGSEPALAPWPDGLRVPGCWDPFEAGVRAIVGQQVTVAGATTTMGAIVAKYGTPVGGLEPLGLTHAFPRPEQLADGDLPMPGRRAAAIHGFADAVTGGRLALDGSLALDDFDTQLCALPGIGPWTAQYLAMRALGWPDAFPPKDVAVLNAMKALFGTQNQREADARAEAWRPWRSYAVLRLWNSLAPVAPSPSSGETP
jgi:AraC family transcriptional regulator of adaptative response / DNA-3-methyladenine glycosylase II